MHLTYADYLVAAEGDAHVASTMETLARREAETDARVYPAACRFAETAGESLGRIWKPETEQHRMFLAKLAGVCMELGIDTRNRGRVEHEALPLLRRSEPAVIPDAKTIETVLAGLASGDLGAFGIARSGVGVPGPYTYATPAPARMAEWNPGDAAPDYRTPTGGGATATAAAYPSRASGPRAYEPTEADMRRICMAEGLRFDDPQDVELAGRLAVKEARTGSYIDWRDSQAVALHLECVKTGQNVWKLSPTERTAMVTRLAGSNLTDQYRTPTATGGR